LPSATTLAGHVRAALLGLGERGVTSAEYALLATLIAVVISGAVAVFGLSVNNLFSQFLGAF
jgi:Flp pilus assembly pilin Flp